MEVDAIIEDETNDDEDIYKYDKLERTKKLGFRPQSELYCNRLLPYANKIDEESQEMLRQIKEHLAKTVLLRDMKPGIGIVINRLHIYMKLYGLKFSKEDHINFVKLVLSLLDVKSIEPAHLNKYCNILSQLLKKSSFLSPDDIEIDWRPLYRIANYVLNKNCSKGDLYRCFSSLESSLQFVIQQCSLYFSKNATQEILDEMYPKLFPLDIGKTCSSFEMLAVFLSSINGHELWLTDFMSLWDSYHNPPWSMEIMNIISFVASQNIGQIDWEPYLPTMFTRILRSMDLPVCYKGAKSSRMQTLYPSSIAMWIAAVLSPKNSTQKHLEKFMGVIESYLHPANIGKWQSFISEILVQLPKYLFDRLIFERFKKHPWKKPVPDEHKLTDNCLTAFVECFKPVAFQVMYSRVNTNDVGKIFKHLADLRPEMIIPDVIDRVFSTLDSLTEPHKMTAALQCLVSVSRALVSGHNGYTTGKTHVIPILFGILPGIDPNDLKKTSVTLQFFTTFALLVPITDCSKASLYYTDLTDEELLICGQTADFEDFVLQYLDRIFSLIESSAQDSTRLELSDMENTRSKVESIIEALIQSSTHGILGQCSKEIIQAASRKFIDFVKTHLFEPRVAAHLVASLVRVFSRVDAHEISKSLLTHLVETINKYISEREDIFEIEKQSDEMLYYIILLTSIVRGDPRVFIHNVIDDIIPIIDKISKFKCKLTNRYANAILINILNNLSSFQTLDIRSSPESFTLPLNEFLPIRHWGQKTDTDTKINWYIPDENARNVCEAVIHRYLPDILLQFEKYCADEIELSRDEILRMAAIVLALLKCANFIPNWSNEEDPLELINTVLEHQPINVTLGFEHLVITMPNGENIRLAVIRTMTKLQKKILLKSEDDTKSLKTLMLLWERVHARKQYNSPFDSQFKNYVNLKMFQEYRLVKCRQNIRAVLATRVMMQQDCRDELTPPCFTPTHKIILFNLLALATSHYSAVRTLAQNRLFILISNYAFSYRCIIDEIVKYLSLDSNENHESFKGILYVLSGHKRLRIIVKNDWECVHKLWLALLKTNLSEKPSVVRLLDDLVEAIHNEFPTLTITLDFPNDCIENALNLLPDTYNADARNQLIETGKQHNQRINELNTNIYHDILNNIIEISHNNSLHWRYGLMASSMIYNLVHPDVKYPAIIANYCVHNLINELIEERKTAVRCINYILQQQKREHIKIRVDPFKLAGIEKPSTGEKLKPGVREDNRWLQYDIEKVPRNQKEWDEANFVHKSEGYFGWTPNFSVYAPNDKQPKLDRTRDEMNDVEKIIYDFFKNESNIDKLIEFWSLEEKKGKEKFNRSRCILMKHLCDMFGDLLLAPFFVHLKRLIIEKKSESNHRCAAELLGGILRGLKHWPYEKTNRIYQEELQPIIRLALNNITVETDVFWGTCFATAAEGIDPRKQYWLHEVLLEEPLRESTSFVDCSRIYCLQGPFNQHVWRMNTVSHRLLHYLKPFLNHPFQNVRERLGSILINIFEGDLSYPGANEPECPRIKDIISEVVQNIQILHNEMPKIKPLSTVNANNTSSSSNNSSNGGGGGSGGGGNDDSSVMIESPSTVDSEYDKAIRLFKTISQWLVGVLNRNTNGNIAEYFELLTFACRLERCEQDLELAETCTSLLAMISQALTLPDCMDVALKTISDISFVASWSARLAVLDVLQILVFNNMAIVLNKEEWIQQVQIIVLKLLEDTVLEVREKAAQVLGGLIHCSFLPATDKLLELFKKKCRTKVIKSARRMLQSCSNETTNNYETQEAESVRMRHMGVLGLCAFISAYPYDIPDFVPDVFEHLGAHLNDPQPIPSTIRKTVGDFKRTHHDNWASHQLKFTEDQLAVLSDLTIPPSYYA